MLTIPVVGQKNGMLDKQTMGMTSQTLILRVRGSWNMHWFMAYSSVTCAFQKLNSHLITYSKPDRICVVSKEHAQACCWSVGYLLRGCCSAVSASGKWNDDWYAAPNQVHIHFPCLSKVVELASAQLTGNKGLLSGITRQGWCSDQRQLSRSKADWTAMKILEMSVNGLQWQVYPLMIRSQPLPKEGTLPMQSLWSDNRRRNAYFSKQADLHGFPRRSKGISENI